MHFQLFFPNAGPDTGQALRKAGLPDFVDGATSCQVVISGQPGLLVGWGPSVGYAPEVQRWIDGPGYRIGFWTDKPCLPEELARGSLFPGYRMSLADGNLWIVPAASELPTNIRLVDSKWTHVRKPQFDEYWARSEVWFRRLVLLDLNESRIREDAGLNSDELLAEWVDFVVFALRQNYRLTPLIASELGLIDSASLFNVTMSAVDGMAIREVLDELLVESERENVGLAKKNDGVPTQDS